MARRRSREEFAFGSDSFLDIVANIVGILIVLIVIAGVRVSHLPPVTRNVETAESAANPPNETDAVTFPDSAADDPPADLPPAERLTHALPPADLPSLSEDVTSIARNDLESEEVPPVVPEPPPLSPELVEEANRLEEEIRALELRQQQLAREDGSLAAELDELSDKIKAARKSLDEKQAVLARGRKAVADQEAALDEKTRQLATLQVTLAEIEAVEPRPQILRHKLTPVGREVTGEEAHFLLSRGRVAVVPMTELADELGRQIQRKRDQLLRTERYVGSIGPIQGFRMDYVIERQIQSLIEELRLGRVTIRMGVSEFQIHPEPGVVTESADQALHPHGRFLAALRRAGPDATLTFWVYPDSFALHRELQQFCQEQGFEVAARPLPEGIPITGSPQGSRSVAQ